MKKCTFCEKKSSKRGQITAYHNDKLDPPRDYEVCSECRRWLTRIFRNYKQEPIFTEKTVEETPKQMFKRVAKKVNKTRKIQGKKKPL